MGNWFTSYFSGNAEPDQGLKNAEHSELRESIQKGGPTGLARHLDIRRRSCKEEPINLGIAGRPNTETTGALQPQVLEEKSDVAKMRDIAKREGHSGVVAYIEDNIDKWKKEPVKFGIIGRTATGKSSFVNLVRDVKEGEKGFAEVGCGDTTQSPTPYFHPDNNQIVFWDLPGVGTLEFPKDTYIKEMELHKYDYFFVFFDTVLQEDDLWLAKQLIKMKKPFCLVRSKVDKDVKKGLKNGIDEKTVYVNLRTKTFKSLNTHIHLKAHCKIFFISGQKKGVGEIDKLFQHIKENLSSIKSEAVVYTLHTLSQEMIEEKFKSLKSRVNTASLGTALISASPIPGIDVYANISILVNEIKHYIEVFGLTHKQIRKVSYRDQKQLKCKELFGLNSEKRTRKIVSAMFVNKYLVLFTALSVSDIFLPIVGSLISAGTTATLVYKFLNEILENLHQDAVFVYDLILPLPVRIIKALKVRFENEGQVGLNKNIFDMLDRWKDETIMIGVIGEPNSGKNEFINQIRRLKMNNSGFSKENKTTIPYYHPDNERIVFIGTDISGSKEIQIDPYDDFYFFLNDDIHTDDISIFRDLTKKEKSVSVIRTKYESRHQDQETILGTGLDWLGFDTDLEILVKRDEEIDSIRLRKIICSQIFKDNECENDSHPNVCVLSCLHISIGEINELINHMIKNLPLPKSEAVVNALYPLSKLVIEEKFQYLKKRIVYLATAATSTTALQIPSICFPLNTHILADELKHYIKVFRFSDKGDGSHKISDVDINTLLCKELLEPGVVLSDIIHTQIKVLSSDDNIAANENIADLFYPVAGSLVSSANNAAIVYKCLTAFLEDFRHDAFVVYDHLSA
ncbi:uncharacterized protein LOC143052611 isoform X1 [Mytilus galloprovincialis]|uniref:uncharacterized protein LOC143052611 isoform X1 n=1 Tax=Mytilus galloprovincialis TaxID=29158 RepID=UPI003F7B5582